MVISKLRINWFVKIIGYDVEKFIYLIDRSSLSMDVSMYCREKEKYEDGAKDREKKVSGEGGGMRGTISSSSYVANEKRK